MAKNMIRKAFASGLGAALVSSALIATPAQAAGEVTLAVNGGTGTTTILGETFSLKATIGALVPDSSNSTLKFYVTNSTGAALTYTADAGTPETGANSDAAEGTQVDGSGTSATASSTLTTDAVKGVFTADTGTGDGNATFEDNQTLGISSAATTAHSITVQAWLDSDGDGTVDSSEFASDVVTVNFVKLADAGIQVELTQPQLGDTTVSAKVTSSVINVAQVAAANFEIQFAGYDGGTGTLLTANTVLTAGSLAGEPLTLNALTKASLDASKDAVKGSWNTANDSAIVADTYFAQAIYSPDAGTTAYVTAGLPDVKVVGAAKVSSTYSEAVIVESTNVNNDGKVRATYTGDVTVQVTVADQYAAALAGKVVRLSIPSTGLNGTFKVNGVAAAVSTDYEATTDANGVATFVITSSTAVAGNDFPIGAIKSDGVSISADFTDLEWVAVAYDVIEVTDVYPISNTSEIERSVASGASFTLSLEVRDQWAQLLKDADMRLKATASGRTVTTLTDTLEDGVATFVVPDGANSTGQTTIAIVDEELILGTWTSSIATHTVNNFTSVKVTYYGATTGTVVYVEDVDADTVNSVAADLKARTEVKALVATSPRSQADATSFTDVANGGTNGDADVEVNLVGTVKSTVGALKPGSMITVSGSEDILFNVGGTYAFGSLSFYSVDGYFHVKAYSNKVLTNSVVTVSANGVTDTVKVSFYNGPTNAGATLTIDAPAAVAPGSTLQATILLVDKYGNGVDTDITATNWNDDADATDVGETDAEFSVTMSGPGITIATLPTATGADGTAVVNRLLGQNDTGTIVITAVYGGADGVIGTGDDDIVATKSITVGTVGNVGAYSSWTKKLDDNSAKMYAKNVVGEGKVQFFLNGEEIAWVRAVDATDPKLRTANGSAYLVRTVEFEDGKNVLEIYLDGVRTTRTAYTK